MACLRSSNLDQLSVITMKLTINNRNKHTQLLQSLSSRVILLLLLLILPYSVLQHTSWQSGLGHSFTYQLSSHQQRRVSSLAKHGL